MGGIHHLIRLQANQFHRLDSGDFIILTAIGWIALIVLIAVIVWPTVPRDQPVLKRFVGMTAMIIWGLMILLVLAIGYTCTGTAL